MVKIFNRGLSKKGVKEIAKRFDMEFFVGQIIGNKSKTMEKFDPNTNMGSICYGTCPIPLSWFEVSPILIYPKIIISPFLRALISLRGLILNLLLSVLRLNSPSFVLFEAYSDQGLNSLSSSFANWSSKYLITSFSFSSWSASQIYSSFFFSSSL